MDPWGFENSHFSPFFFFYRIITMDHYKLYVKTIIYVSPQEGQQQNFTPLNTCILWNFTDLMKQFYIWLVLLLIWCHAAQLLNFQRFFFFFLNYYFKNNVKSFYSLLDGVLYVTVGSQGTFSGGRGNCFISMGNFMHMWLNASWTCNFFFC